MVTHTEDEFYKAFQVLFGRISSQEPVNLSHLVSLKVSCHSHGNDDEIIINVNCKDPYSFYVSKYEVNLWQHQRLLKTTVCSHH